jgi:hypothetical protein
LDFGVILHIEEILFVRGLKKNLLSVLALEDKGFRVTFMDGEALMWPKDGDMSSADVIGVREGGLYRLPGRPIQAMVHDTISLCEQWHRRFAHLHYRALPGVKKMVTGMPDLQFEHDRICRGCTLGKNAKKSFPSNNKRCKGILDLIHSDLCGPMSTASLSGYLYYVIFIDDFSRKTWILEDLDLLPEIPK